MNYNIERVKNYTQAKLDTWYKNAKIDYNVEGSAAVWETEDGLVIVSRENGEEAKFALSHEVLAEEKIDYLFNNWMEG